MKSIPVRHPLRRSKLKPRSVVAIVVGAALLALSRPRVPWLAIGAGPLVVGLALRSWAAGHLVKSRELAVGGPYRFVRHPLYAGTLLIGSAFAIAAGPPAGPVFLIALWIFFFGYYFPYKERVESERLLARHGEAFALYRARVPALLPFPGRAYPREPRGRAERWSWEKLAENDELGTLLGSLAAFAVLAVLAARSLPG